MPNIADLKVELKSAIPANTDAVVILVAKWPEKSTPQGAPDTYTAEITALAGADLFNGKSGAVAVHLLPGKEGPRLVVIGLGDREKITSEIFRVAGGALAKTAKKHRLKNIAVLSAADPAAVAWGFLLGSFVYTDYKGTATKGDKSVAPIRLTFVGDTKDQAAIHHAVITADAQNFARAIASRPGNDINPPSLAKVAEQLAKEGEHVDLFLTACGFADHEALHSKVFFFHPARFESRSRERQYLETSRCEQPLTIDETPNSTTTTYTRWLAV